MALCDTGEQVAQIDLGAMLDLLQRGLVFHQPAQVRAGGEVKAEHLADKVGAHLRGWLWKGAKRGDTVLKFRLDNRQRIAVLDIEAGRKEITQQRVGALLHLLIGPAAEENHVLW